MLASEVSLAVAVENLQKRVVTLEAKLRELLRVVYAGGGGVSRHNELTGLGDDDHTQYVPVDGVARQLANAGYPNALLLDGSRAMTGDFNLGSEDATHSRDLIFGNEDVLLQVIGDVLYVMNQTHGTFMPFKCGYFSSTSESSSEWTNGAHTQGFRVYPPSSIFQAVGSPAAIEPIWNNATALLNFQSWDGSQRVVRAVLGNGKFAIPYAGDIDHGSVSNAVGPILKDRTTGTKYRLYVDNGSLSIESV